MAEKNAHRIDSWLLNLERNVLGACIQGMGTATEKVVGFLKEEDFYDRDHQLIWRAIKSLYLEGAPIDIATVYDRLNTYVNQGPRGFPFAIYFDAVTLLTSGDMFVTATAAHIAYYGKRLKEVAVLRRAGYRFGATARDMLDSKLPNAQEALQGAIDSAVGFYTELQVELPIAPEIAIDRAIQHAYQRKGNSRFRMTTKISPLDEKIGGLFPPDLIVIAGRPSMGKTDLALNILYNLAKSGFSMALASIEMGMDDIYWRLFALETAIFRGKFRTGAFDETDDKALQNSIDSVKRLPLFIRSGSIDLHRLQDWAAETKRRQGLSLLAVDYIQIITGAKASNREQQMATISAGLKALAVELVTPVIAVSQMSRAAEFRTTQLPQLSDLRDSGAIEQDADIVMMLFRESYYAKKSGAPELPATEDHLDIHVLKNRAGETGVVKAVSYNRATGHIGRSARMERPTGEESPQPITETGVESEEIFF